MTRYSASRGIRYSAPPGPDGGRGRDDSEATDERAAETDDEAEPAARDATADD